MRAYNPEKAERAGKLFSGALIVTFAMAGATFGFCFGVGEYIQHTTNDPGVKQTAKSFELQGLRATEVELVLGTIASIGAFAYAERAGYGRYRQEPTGTSISPSDVPPYIMLELPGPGLSPETAKETYEQDN